MGEPFRWYISQPPKWGPLTSHRSRFPSDSRTKAPFRVPTSTRSLLIAHSLCRGLRLPRLIPLYGRMAGSRFDIPGEVFSPVATAREEAAGGVPARAASAPDESFEAFAGPQPAFTGIEPM